MHKENNTTDLKNLLQNGTVVKLRNHSNKFIVVDGVIINDKFVLITNIDCYYSINLKHKFSNDFDIMQVETLIGKVIWSREHHDSMKLRKEEVTKLEEEVNLLDKQIQNLWKARNNLCTKINKFKEN